MREITTEPTLSYSKAFVFVMDEFVKMLKQGYCESTICMNNSMKVSYAVENDEVIGACVYELDKNKRQAWIYFASVSEKNRGQKIYDEIYAEVEKNCKSEGMVVINSNIHIDNISMISSAKKNNRELLWYRSRKFI